MSDMALPGLYHVLLPVVKMLPTLVAIVLALLFMESMMNGGDDDMPDGFV